MKTVVVYTMGRCGSKALYEAIERAGMPALHIHTLQAKKIDRIQSRHEQQKRKPALHILDSMKFLENQPEQPIFVSSAREPLSRNLSAFFNNVDASGEKNQSVAHWLKRFEKNYPHRIPAEWFDTEFKACCGIDIYAAPFDHDRLYVRGQNWIVFRSDCPDEIKSEALSELLETQVRIERSNEGEGKKNGALYSKVKPKAKFSNDFITKLYDTKYAKHFWSNDELEALSEKWAKVDA